MATNEYDVQSIRLDDTSGQWTDLISYQLFQFKLFTYCTKYKLYRLQIMTWFAPLPLSGTLADDDEQAEAWTTI